MTRTAHIFGVVLLAGRAIAADDGKTAPPRPSGQPMAQKPSVPRPHLAPLAPKPADMKKGGKHATSPLLASVPSPITTLDRWNRMTPDQRRRSLAKLTPERRQQIQERLDRFNALPPQEQERLRRRYDRFSHLPSDRQAIVKRQIQAFIKMPEDRRPTISREFEQLRRLPAGERQARINSEEFRNRYSPREQQLLADLSGAMSISASR